MALFSALSRAGIRHLAFRQVIQRVPGLAGAVDLHLAAGPRPDIVGRFGLAGDQRVEHRPARLGRLQHGLPQLVGLGQHAAVVARQAGLLAVAGDIRLGASRRGIRHPPRSSRHACPASVSSRRAVSRRHNCRRGAAGSRESPTGRPFHPHAQPVVFGVGRQFVVAELADGALQLVELAGAEGVAGVQEGSIAILGENGSARASNRGAKRVRNFMLDYGDARSERG
jgi:hypothetical protein